MSAKVATLMEKITLEQIDELLQYLLFFTDRDSIIIQKWIGGKKSADNVFSIPYPQYSKNVGKFFRLASQPCWCDYEYNPEQAGKMLEDRNFIKSASMDQIKTMLTYCCRGERFCDGFWGAVIRKGRIKALLKRLQVLRSSM